AMTAEAVGMLSEKLYNKPASQLTEDEKATVSAFASLAAGIAGGLVGGDTSSAGNAAQAGKTTVENNALSLPHGLADYGQSAFTLAESMEKKGYSIHDVNAALNDFAKGDHPEGQDPARGFLEAWGNMVGIPLDVFWSNEQMTPEKAAEILSGSPPTTTAKALQFTAAKAYLAFAKSGKEMPSWDAGKGEYSFKDAGKVTDVKHPNNQFDGKTVYDASGSVYEGGVWKPKVTNGSQNAIDKDQLANPITQSRINIQNGNAKAGWEHLVKRHFSGKPNASQFTISQSEVKSLLQNPDVTKVPISKIQTSDNKATGQKEILYQRVVTLDKPIGIDKFSNKPTNTMTILTDKHGNLVTATPGVID
ncbi:VENN motif pre-toxin domain-containing protein, partial [Providencia rettgeri]